MLFLKLFAVVLLNFVSSEDQNLLHLKNESNRIVCPKLECPLLSNNETVDSTKNPSDICFSHDGSSPTSLI